MQGVYRDEYPWEPGNAVYLDDATWLPVDQVQPFRLEQSSDKTHVLGATGNGKVVS